MALPFVKENKQKIKRSQVCPSAWGLLEKIHFGENRFRCLRRQHPTFYCGEARVVCYNFQPVKKRSRFIFSKKKFYRRFARSGFSRVGRIPRFQLISLSTMEGGNKNFKLPGNAEIFCLPASVANF